jgi:Ni,Fe-hydrogenase III small subunit/Pyruvate/2-oxoacid:ferredoxin oxidoreductase delta subunit
MLKIIRSRLIQKYQTIGYPESKAVMPELYRGLPALDNTSCKPHCRSCIEICPTHAIDVSGIEIALDLGRCIFCGACEQVCPVGKIHFTAEINQAAGKLEDLIVHPGDGQRNKLLNPEAARLFGKSLKLCQVSAGGCNACEVDTNVLNTIVFDLSRFGIQFVASPRHADGLLITGPVTENMKLALLKTYEAIPFPKIVIAVGACALSGGIYAGHTETNSGVGDLLPVDLYVPGCPPHPLTVLDGLLRLLGKVI